MMRNYRWLVWLLIASTEQVSAQDEEVPVVESIGTRAADSVLEYEPGSVRLDVDEVVNMPGSGDDPLAVLDNLPGMNQAGDGVYMRGSSTTDNKFLVNDQTIPYLYHFGDALSLINKEMLASFEVYPSGFDALYGNRLGGVVDIRLRNPRQLESAEHRLHLGTYDAGYFVEGSLGERTSGYFSIRRSHLDLLLTGASTEDVEFIQFPKFVDSIARLRHELDNGELNLSFIGSTDELKFDLGEGAVDADKAAVGELQSKQSFASLAGNYQSVITPQLSQKTSLIRTFSHSEVEVGEQQLDDPNPGKPYNFDFDQTEVEFNPQFTWTPTLSDSLTLSLGTLTGTAVLSGYISAPPNERDDPGDTLTESEKFLLDEDIEYEADSYGVSYQRDWSERFTTTAGFYDEQFSLYKRVIKAPLSPRLRASYRVTDNLSTHGSVGRYYQAPQGYELSESLGNPLLNYQKADHYSVGFQWQWRDDWSLQMDVYRKPMGSLVVETEDERIYDNSGSGVARGLDLFIKRSPQERHVDWISYAWAESERYNPNTGLRRPFDGEQRHTLVWVHQQPFSGGWSEWQWGFKMKTHSGKPYTPVVDRSAASLDPEVDCMGDGETEGCYWSPIYARQNSDRLPVYFNIDLSMNKSVDKPGRRFDIKLELLNASALLYSNIGDYDYGDDYEHIDKPKGISDSFGLLPAASMTWYFE